MTTAVQENITGVRTVKSFAREPHEVDKFKLCNENYKETNIHTSKIWAKYFPVMELMANISVVILLDAGGYMVIQKQMTVGELVAFFSLIWYIIGPMWNIGMSVSDIRIKLMLFNILILMCRLVLLLESLVVPDQVRSTIISLLMRAYNVKEGSIFLAGIDIKDVTISSL
ncbi:putative multidrug resistance ABC transporter ATP-binding/permease protein YheI [Paenibacillus larvae subsp. larvae]|uniref:Putative multidrug resistance ABC transporter ATP-binding/permease protein YheI n=1 Tax=Paenibacillus larvae subsp. larvae TaxID=147375 RepID=A0A2L1TYV2_9BACL|nr:hypothetical protein B1222_20830 [Paenibacillus larvae subsp. pulvifaciens]AVF25856.1 putative multidrug resistance ABC transporter ATP-binding/permease protein YheI [Paenibacillus larvae subsp. larvae]AVF30633.1 putative multidrug resistance ABC transporter ATP-binding/permease protein YheI [Paenibacillus larvae subsp. larvae]